MTGHEFKSRLHKVKFTAGMCARYHHAYEEWYGKIDKVIRAAVAILAVISLPLAVKDEPPWGLVLAIGSLAIAVVLNIYLVGDWEKSHGELFKLWSDLRHDAEAEELKSVDLGDDDQAPAYTMQRLHELVNKQHSLDSMESFPNERFLNKCQDSETEKEWGPGVTTAEQIEQERKRRLACAAAEVASVEEEAAAAAE